MITAFSLLRTYRCHLSAVRSLAILLLVAGALGLTGCGATVESRIKDHPETFSRLNTADQALVRQGRVREGMDRPTVYLAWGKAEEVYVGERAGRATEIWQYYRNRSSFVDYSPSPYPFYPGGYYPMGPMVVTQEVPGRRAVFVDGRLREWAQPIRY